MLLLHYPPTLGLVHSLLKFEEALDRVLASSDNVLRKRIAGIPIELTSVQRKSYDEAEHSGIVYLKSLGRGVRLLHVLELIMRL